MPPAQLISAPLSALAETDELFYGRAGLDRAQVERRADEALKGADDGELFLEYRQSEALSFDDGRLKTASFDTAQGFGLRAVSSEATGFAHATELSDAALKRATDTVRTVRTGKGGVMAEPPQGTNRALYGPENPLSPVPFAAKVKILEEMDAYARGRDPRVRQVTASITGSWQAVQIVRAGGFHVADVRPMVRLNVSIMVEKDGRMETGSFGTGGRVPYESFLKP
ncbi:MAG: metalloprotease TldD, partial [Alphaproteobacteria bacterium]|nr:metalloprotease TldD [Alphaproteobacteria bacterium]